MMMIPTEFHENGTDMSRAYSIKTEVAAYLADTDRSLVRVQNCPVAKATFVHNTTLLTPASVEILQNWRSN